MRFVSHSPGFCIEVVKLKAYPTQYGDMVVDQEQINAQFNQNDVTDADLEFARTIWPKMEGFTTLIDEVTPTPILDRVSVYDTDEEAIRNNWEGQTVKDERGNVHDLKTYIEAKLSERAVRHTEFRQVEAIPVEPPWPNYLQFRGTMEDLIGKLTADGYDLGHAVRYEQQLGRTQVVEALQAEITRQQQEVESAQQVPA